jgi:hypothetical protein
MGEATLTAISVAGSMESRVDHRRAAGSWADPGFEPEPRRLKLEIYVRAEAGDEAPVNGEDLPEWVRLAVRRLEAVGALPQGWSGRLGPPVEIQLVPRAFDVIRDLVSGLGAALVPQVVPTVEGGLQLEWHRDGFDLEIVMSPFGDVWVDFERIDGSEAWEGDYEDHRETVRLALKKAAEGRG